MANPFQLSVVIPNLNRASSLVRAVLSVRDDSPDAEIIVVDDCSDADLSAEYACLQDIGVRVFRQEVRRRGGAARNRGVRHASGTHVSFLDSDDVWMPGRHDRIRRFYGVPGTERTVLVSGALLHVNGEIRKPHQPLWRPGSALVDYVYRDMGRVQTSMMTLPIEIARACPWDETLRVNQDTDLAMRLDRLGIGFHIDSEPGIIKEESICPGRLTTGTETADLSHAWYRRESADWSPAARSGYHLQDRVWRLADSGRRREAFAALARSLCPPVSLRETLRRALCMTVRPQLYERLRESYRARVQVPRAVDAVQKAAGETWRVLDARAHSFCAVAQSGFGQRGQEPASAAVEAA
ncbi:glycosyltransferase [Paracoccus sp. YIM 132242]|uniref:Glycosyltransferase n=1 Tax=Paracoccus lichenicola TaxID=2665644 RepID=A0A6L6HNQ2_9RHOB|nr:glycosyltransferase family 2 protein [Paracoccus lichenicola]MTD99832.1 glycosyltransferase [Paracoccus lichenicola]